MIKGDSSEYELLEKWAKGLSNLNNYKLSCEIGVREGLGSKIILDSLQPHEHYGIDPYGNLKYQHYDDSPAYTADYTDEMKDRLQKDLSSYKNFELFAITDTDFMNIYHHYSPYCFVHFDGPHMTRDVLTEAVWFANRSGNNCRFVFDDYPKYNMPLIQSALEPFGFKKLEAGKNKICLEKRRNNL